MARILIICIFSIFSLVAFGQTSYLTIKANTEQQRLKFSQEYSRYKGDSVQQKIIINQAQAYVLKDIDTYFKAWYTTPWAFHGHTQTPRNGKIACGYFITTTLQDMGFKIPRIKWAQLASEDMIKKLTNQTKRFRNKPMADVVNYIETKGEGLYIVGLDNHVGYIYYSNKQMRFVHSNYYYPAIGVMSEKLIGRNPLNDSKYRIIGKILDNEMISKWILGEQFIE